MPQMCKYEADLDENLSNTEGLEGDEALKGKMKIKKKRKRKRNVIHDFAENMKGVESDMQIVQEKPMPLSSKVDCSLLITDTVTTVEKCSTSPCNSSCWTRTEDADFSRELSTTETDQNIKKKKKVNRNPINGSIDADASTTIEHFSQENLISSSLQSFDTTISTSLTKDHSNKRPEEAPENEVLVDKKAPSASSVPLVKGKKHIRKQRLDNGSLPECGAALELLDRTSQRSTEREVDSENSKSLKSILPAETDVCNKVKHTLLSDKDHRKSTDDKTKLSVLQAESAELVIKENIDRNNQANIIPCILEAGKRNHKKKKDRKKHRISPVDKNLGLSEVYPSTTTLSSSETAINGGALKEAPDELCKSKMVHDVSDGENLENQKKRDTYLPSVDDDSYLENISSLTHKENNSLEKPTDLHIARALSSHPRRKLLILDLNGILVNTVDIFWSSEPQHKADKKIGRKYVFKRPFCDEFLEFCFGRFDVGIWSSLMKKNLQPIVKFLLGNMRSKLLFCWDGSSCTKTGLYTINDRKKPLVLKDLKKIWDKEWENVQYTPSCTLLVDDSPYKALFNPACTGIFPRPFMLHNKNDNALGRGGAIRGYLEGLVKADDVQEYLKKRPFGQRAITSDHPDWDFYKQVLVSRVENEPQI